MRRYIVVLKATVLKELRVWKRNRPKLGLIVLLPIVYWLSFNLLMGGVYSSGVEAGLVVEETNRGYYTNALIEVLGEHDSIPPSLLLVPMDRTSAQARFESGDILLVIVIPSGFENALANNESTSVSIWVNNFHEDATKNLRLPVIRKLDIFYQRYLNKSTEVNFQTELLHSYTYPRLAYMAWTTAIYGVMFGSLYAAGSSMTQEFENETFDELEMSGESSSAIYSGKMFVGIGFGYIPAILLFILAFLLFGVWPNGNLVVFILVSLLLAMFASGLGLVFGALSRNSVYMVPITALLSLVYWILCGGIAPLLIGGISFDIIDSYSPISNAYRSVVTMFVSGGYPTLATDLTVLGIATCLSLLLSPVIAYRLSKIDYSQKLRTLPARRKK